MSSDSRWTGGLANREWQRGTRIEAPVDGDAVLRAVREYLRDCRRFHLPASEDMAVKVTWGPEKTVRAAYQHLTSARGVSADA